jgi:outer membrane protein OmpA-like peptidoglycan-associated protein
MYLTTNNKNFHEKNKNTPLQISFAKSADGLNFETPEIISFGMPDSISLGHPSVLNDTLMFFVSDMQRGFGGADIYYSKKINNVWQKPVNCGPQINSKYNEEFPFVVSSKLYFSSDRPGGAGGLDVYTANMNALKFESSQRFGTLINGSKDDFGIFTDSLAEQGYFSSNRNGNDDLYYFYSPAKPELKNCTPQLKNEYCFTFFEEASESSMDTVGMIYEWSFGDGTKAKGLEAVHCFDGEGKYLVELNVIDLSSGEIFLNELSYEFEIKNHQQLYISIPDTIYSEKEYAFNPSYSKIENLEIKKYLWDFGDGITDKKTNPKHKYSQPGNYVVSLGGVGFSGGKQVKLCVTKNILVIKNNSGNRISEKAVNPKTNKLNIRKTNEFSSDANGSKKNNFNDLIEFSKKDSFMNRFLSGIPDSALRKQLDGDFRFYHPHPGDSALSYKIHLGVSDKLIETDDAVFKGLQDITAEKTESLYHYFYGKYKSAGKALDAIKMVKEKGFDPRLIPFLDDILISNFNPAVVADLMKDTLVPQNSNDHPFVLFSYNQSVISESEKNKLKVYLEIVKPLKTSEKIILEGHTDSRGETDYNLKLSENRISAVKTILLKNGISEEQIISRPFGEKNPVFKSEQEELKGLNRRVEIILFNGSKNK